MSVSWASDDDRLWSELQEAVRQADAVPPELRAAARGAFTWRTIDAELLELAEDAALTGVTAVRGQDGDGRRTLEFRGTDLSISIELAAGGAAGQLLPAGPNRLTRSTPDGATTEVEVDESGFFRFPVAARETFRLQVEADGSSRVTPWVTP